MHRDTLTDVTVAQNQHFLITASIDGHLKFWKKTPTGIEFAKHYRAHVGSVDGESYTASVFGPSELAFLLTWTWWYSSGIEP